MFLNIELVPALEIILCMGGLRYDSIRIVFPGMDVDRNDKISQFLCGNRYDE